MLAQNLKTPAELNLQERHHRALVLTLNALERGELRHVPVTKFEFVKWDDANAPFTMHFNMSTWRGTHRCGTVCCLGGTAEYLGGLCVRELDALTRRNGCNVLADLFYPEDMNDILPERAAQVLRHYLTTGVVNWQLEP